MSRTATWLLTAGMVLFIAVLASQNLNALLATLARAGWGLPLVALFHMLPLMIDAAAIVVLFAGAMTRKSFGDGLLARWVGESANSLMPAGQLGGPVLMARFLGRRRRRHHRQHHPADLCANPVRPGRRNLAGCAGRPPVRERMVDHGAARERIPCDSGGRFLLVAAARHLQQVDRCSDPHLGEARLVEDDLSGSGHRS
jgi:hypothetical protein